MPEATIEIPVQFVRMFPYFREILSEYIRIRIGAFGFSLIPDYGASRMGYVGDFIPKPLTRDFAP